MYALEDLKNRVRSRQSRRYVGEAIAAYGAGAYRSAIIAVWIAVAADLIEKIRLLADEGVPEAADLRAKLDDAIKEKKVSALQSFERDLVEVAEKRLKLIGAREATELSRLYEDRHLCAHPAFVAGDDDLFAPTAELVRTHLAAAVDAVLSHRAVTGRKAIERFEREVEGESYPRDDQRLEEYLRASYLDHATGPLLGNLIKVACKSTLDAGNSIATRWRYTRAARVMQKVAPAAFEERAAQLLQSRQDVLTDEGLGMLVAGLCYVPGTWDLLHQGTRNKIEQLLSSSPISRLVADYMLFYGPLPHAPVDGMLLARVPDLVTIKTSELEYAPTAYLGEASDRRLLEPLIQALKDARSYMDGEAVLKWINAVVPILTAEDLQKILKVSSENNQIRGSVLGRRQLEALRWQTVGLGDTAKQAWAEWDAQWAPSTEDTD
ncbi:hypothetical protein AB0442_28570 [Kitasatospora sp. NPDC085895]|uniref:hypothetical protein n=1 Tax=Kitasatospora sp. NPDC085895 TaxID=3155057 RepID=UPI00344B3D27